eukprot:COSAG05_NODE_4046_length_1701_cov_5.385556_2_plen_60_part_00
MLLLLLTHMLLLLLLHAPVKYYMLLLHATTCTSELDAPVKPEFGIFGYSMQVLPVYLWH